MRMEQLIYNDLTTEVGFLLSEIKRKDKKRRIYIMQIKTNTSKTNLNMIYSDKLSKLNSDLEPGSRNSF